MREINTRERTAGEEIRTGRGRTEPDDHGDHVPRGLNGVRVEVWDSPGPPHRRNASEPYFSKMASSIAHSNLFVFCINVGDAVPFDADAPEVKCVETLTRRLSPSLWDHAVVALTFANRLGQTSAEVRQAKQMNDAGRLK